jgi:AAA family ATP:ADP antiporter
VPIVQRALLCGAFFFFTMVTAYILKPIREGLFLEAQPDRVAHSHLGVAVATFFFVQFYAQLMRRIPNRQLIVQANAAFVVAIGALWVCLRGEPAGDARTALAWIAYIGVSIYTAFSVTLFWSFAHDVFTPGEGKRIYGYVGAAGIAGGFAGSMLTSWLVKQWGIANLLVVAGLLLLPCMAIVLWMSPRVPSTTPAKAAKPQSEVRAAQLFGESAYLRGILVLVFLYTALAVLVDYESKAIARSAYRSKEEFAAFFASIYNWVNVIGFVANMALTGPVQTRFGPLPGLLSLPLVGMLGGIGFWLAPSLDLAFWVTVLGLAMTYSMHQASKEILYLPVPSSERYVAKAFIDTFVFRLGNGAAAIWLMWAVPPIGAGSLSAAIVLVTLGMMTAATWLSRRHARILSEA